jgi:hypothetical protein
VPKRSGLPVSQSLNFTATVGNDPANRGATWTATGSNCTGSPACGSFSVGTPTTSATYTSPSTAGTYTITATSVADPTQSASATVGVTDLAGVFTYHNNLSGDGVNAHEYALTTSNVATATFGKLFSCTVDGAIYTQPLWIPGLTITANGTTATHNVIIVGTQNDSLYAFDADASPCTLLWSKNLINQGEAPVPAGTSGNLVGRGAGDITPAVGVTGTPVIDPSTNPPTLYVVSKSYTTTGPTFYQRLHAIAVTTGNELLGGPVPISASVAGTAPDASGGQVAFNPQTQNQRAALALVGNVVYVCWGAHEDQQPYHGWVMGFNKTTLSLVTAFNPTAKEPDLTHGGGGIWMAGGSPTFDGTNLFLITGNGHWDGSADFGDSVLKLSISNTGALSVADFFTPSDQDNLAANDLDLGSGGAVTLVDVPLAPVPRLLVAGGKQGSGNPGELFVLNRDALGRFNSTDSGVVQNFATGNQIFSTPAFWNNTLYVAPAVPSNGKLMSYSFNTTSGLFNTSPSSQSAASFGFPGPTPSISASSGTNGIVWALDGTMYCTNESPGCGAAVLHAYDATNLGKELWNSSQGSGNTAGNAVKFTVPTVANGKVYIGTRGSDTVNGGAGELDVYGLLPN